MSTGKPISQREARRLKAQNKELIKMLRQIEAGAGEPGVEKIWLQEVMMDAPTANTFIAASKCGYTTQLEYSRHSPSNHILFNAYAVKRRSLDVALFEKLKIKFGLY